MKMWILPEGTKIDLNDPIPETAIYCGELDLDKNPKEKFEQGLPFTFTLKPKKDEKTNL